jgi:hypothetical protein
MRLHAGVDVPVIPSLRLVFPAIDTGGFGKPSHPHPILKAKTISFFMEAYKQIVKDMDEKKMQLEARLDSIRQAKK